jgi:hypothetical protein
MTEDDIKAAATEMEIRAEMIAMLNDLRAVDSDRGAIGLMLRGKRRNEHVMNRPYVTNKLKVWLEEFFKLMIVETSTELTTLGVQFSKHEFDGAKGEDVQHAEVADSHASGIATTAPMSIVTSIATRPNAPVGLRTRCCAIMQNGKRCTNKGYGAPSYCGSHLGHPMSRTLVHPNGQLGA